MGLNSTPRTWATGEVVTATELNSEIRDALAGIQAAWEAYTPTWGAPTPPTLGNGTLTGRYRRVGKTVDYEVSLVAGSTTGGGTGQWSFGLPLTYNSRYALRSLFGRALLHTAAGAYYPATVFSAGALSVSLITTDTRSVMSTGTPITLAAGDIITLSGRYEAA